MKVAWAHDDPGYVGGAELTMAEFKAAAPPAVEFVDAPLDADVVVLGNCSTFGPDLIERLEGRRVVRYFHDVDSHSNPELRAWLLHNATLIFCSPLQRDRFGVAGHLIPPAVDLAAYKPTRQIKRHRKGAVTIGAWRNRGKGQVHLSEWASANDTLLDAYGPGPLIPIGPNVAYKGEVPPEDVPGLLWNYAQFVHLPTHLEPFGRSVVEAHAAGCSLVTNNLVGANYWIREAPKKLETAAEDFWEVVMDHPAEPIVLHAKANGPLQEAA